MSRYCEIRLVDLVKAEKIIKQVGKKSKSDNEHKSPLSNQLTKRTCVDKEAKNMVYSSTNKIDQINQNENGGITYSAKDVMAFPKKLTRSSSILQKLSIKDLDKRSVIHNKGGLKKDCSKQDKSVNNPKIQKRPFSLEENCISKQQPPKKSVIEDMPGTSKEIKHQKVKKKRKTHIIIWERKLTGAQRVSKRLSNLKTKYKNSGKVESFNLVPVALIEETSVKHNVQKKSKRVPIPININKNRKKRSKILNKPLLHVETDILKRKGQNKYQKTNSLKRKPTSYIVKVNPNSTVHNVFVQSASKNDEVVESTDTEDLTTHNIDSTADKTECETDNSNSAETPEGVEISGNKGEVNEISIVENTESVNSQIEEKVIESSDITDVVQEESVIDSDIMIVELERIENDKKELPQEGTTCSVEKKEECFSNSEEKDTCSTAPTPESQVSKPMETN